MWITLTGACVDGGDLGIDREGRTDMTANASQLTPREIGSRRRWAEADEDTRRKQTEAARKARGSVTEVQETANAILAELVALRAEIADLRGQQIAA